MEAVLGSVQPKQKDVDAPIGFSGQGIAVRASAVATPHLPPGQKVFFKGGDDLLL